jgi:hypothetical protein
MNLICRIFGHRPAFGYGHCEGEGYFTVRLCEVDGMGVQHATLHRDCQRCGKNYQVGRIAVPRLERKP